MKIYLIAVIFALLCGCSNKQNIENLITKAGLTYAPKSEKPYTGKVFMLQSGNEGKIEGYFQNGLRDGNWNFYWPKGKLHKTETYTNGQIIQRITYYENGKKEMLENYRDSKFDGEYIGYYENGEKKLIKIFNLGKLDEEKSFYSHGKLLYEGSIEQSEENGSNTWKYTYYYPTGSKLCECTQIKSQTSASLIEPSTLKFWYSNGNLRSKIDQIDNYNYNIYSFYSNGNKFYEATYQFPSDYFIDANSVPFREEYVKPDTFIYGQFNLPFTFNSQEDGISGIKMYDENGKAKPN